jgi:Ssl1-like
LAVALVVQINIKGKSTGQPIWEFAVRRDDGDNNIVVVASQDTLAEAIRKSRRILERQDYALRNRRVVRDMIRSICTLSWTRRDSRWIRQKDPVEGGATTVIRAMTGLLTDFLQEYLDQAPVSHLAVFMAKEGEAIQLHVAFFVGQCQGVGRNVRRKTPPEAANSVSLQNALEGP